MYTRHISVSHRPGIAALLVVVIIGSAALVLGLASSARGLNTLELAVSYSATEQSRLQTESCVEESLLQLYRDANWNGGTLSMGDISCTIVVSGNTVRKTMTVSLPEKKPLTITVQFENNAWRIVEWYE
jgi:hypothetical protein